MFGFSDVDERKLKELEAFIEKNREEWAAVCRMPNVMSPDDQYQVCRLFLAIQNRLLHNEAFYGAYMVLRTRYYEILLCGGYLDAEESLLLDGEE